MEFAVEEFPNNGAALGTGAVLLPRFLWKIKNAATAVNELASGETASGPGESAVPLIGSRNGPKLLGEKLF